MSLFFFASTLHLRVDGLLALHQRLNEEYFILQIPAFARMTIFFRYSCGDTLHFEKSLRLLTQSVRGDDKKGVVISTTLAIPARPFLSLKRSALEGSLMVSPLILYATDPYDTANRPIPRRGETSPQRPAMPSQVQYSRL